MARMLSPGVKVTILDYSDYVAEASTSTVGMIGAARRGPVGRNFVTTREQALRIYGDPTRNDYGIHSLLAVLEKGNKVYYDRVVRQPSRSITGDPSTTSIVFASLDYSSLLNGSKVELTKPDWNNDFIAGQFDPTKPEESVSSDENIELYGVDLSTLTDSQRASYFDVTITTLDGTIESFPYCTLNTLERRINGVSELAEVLINEDAYTNFQYGTTLKFDNGTKGASFAETELRDDINFASKYYDSTINGWTIELTERSFLNTFDYVLYNKLGDEVERITSLSLVPGDDRFVETMINSSSNYVTCVYNEDTDNDITGLTLTLSGGSDGIQGITESEIIAALEDFSNEEIVDIDILCTPGWSSSSVITKGLSICETRQECMYLIDPPFGLNVQQVVDWSNCQGNYKRPDSSIYNSSYGAIYWPWVQVYDPFSRSYIWLPPSGFVAAQIAYSDQMAEPWFAPAGLNRGIITSAVNIEMSPTQGERDLLYGNRNVVNPIIDFRQSGIVIWGQKTTQRKSSALDRVNVRRLVNYLKKVITASTYYFVFDPNDQYLWQKWVDMVDQKLSGIKSKRGVYDYKIVMNHSTVTADDIDNNRMPGQVKFKPTKTAEFIPIDFMIMPYSAEFDE